MSKRSSGQGCRLRCVGRIALVLSAGGHQISIFWVLLRLATLATNELLVLALALAPSELTRLAPSAKHGCWLSYWFVAQAICKLLGGVV